MGEICGKIRVKHRQALVVAAEKVWYTVSVAFYAIEGEDYEW